VQDRFAEKYYDNTPYHYALNTPINAIDINGDSTYIIFDGNKDRLHIYNDNNTLDDYEDDELVGSFAAHNNVTSTSNGKWEDGIYDMLDQNSARKHEGEYEADGTTLQDSENGRYGEGGIYRAKNFDETTTDKERTGMGVHAGRENKAFKNRKTLGCLRTTPEAIDAIQNSIDNNGAWHSTIVTNNRNSTNSDKASSIRPGPRISVPTYTAKRDNTRVIVPAALLFGNQ
jgi:hypothetical protein